jgi:hypothetical protein
MKFFSFLKTPLNIVLIIIIVILVFQIYSNVKIRQELCEIKENLNKMRIDSQKIRENVSWDNLSNIIYDMQLDLDNIEASLKNIEWDLEEVKNDLLYIKNDLLWK